MSYLRIAAAVCLILLLTVTAFAQSGWERKVTPFPVSDGVDAIAYPFYGGINDPKPQLVDFDGDGLDDLFVGNEDGRVAWFLNVGTAASPVWEFQSQRLGGINVGSWYRLDDLDADGDPDLFCDNKANGVAFHRNESVGTTPSFVLVDGTIGGFVTGTNNTGDFEDLDNDGDLDFFFGNTNGRLEFYENTGSPSSPSFTLVTQAYDSILAFPGAGPRDSGEPQHGFSAITFADINNDNVLDLLWGDLFNTNLYLFDNLGTVDSSNLTWNTETYLPNGTVGFNHVTLSDLDGDGDLDMLLGVANGSPINNFRYLRNDGIPEAAVFVEVEQNYIETIDYGSQARPAPADLDGDGDIDLLVGQSSGQLAYYENVGSKTAPSFELVSDAWFGIDVGTDATPELADLDNDGDLDLLIGTGLGRIEYWSNEGDANSFNPVQVSTQWLGLKVDQLAVPRVADLNDDNLPDLVVGEWDFNGLANVLLYQNIGTPETPNLVLLTNKLIKQVAREYALVTVYDWDADGRKDLIIGGAGEALDWYRNTTPSGVFPDSLSLVLQPDTLPGYDDGSQLAPAFADVDGDGDDDALIGEDHGGLNYHQRLGTCCQGIRGDFNGDGTDMDPIDLSSLVDYLFAGGQAAECTIEADVNGDGSSADPIDLSFSVDRLFAGGVTPPACP